MTFVWKTRAFNIDEIDARSSYFVVSAASTKEEEEAHQRVNEKK